MKKLIEKFEQKGKSFSVLETDGLRIIIDHLQEGKGVEKASLTYRTVSDEKYKPLLYKRQEILSKNPTDNIKKAQAMATTICDFTGSDYGIGICGSAKLKETTYLSIYDKAANKNYRIAVISKYPDEMLNRVHVYNLICAQLDSLLNSIVVKTAIPKSKGAYTLDRKDR